MNSHLESESMRLLTHIIRQYSHFCHSMIIDVKNSEQLSLSGFSGLDKAQLAIYHINRASNMIETFLGFNRSTGELSLQSFNVKQIIGRMCETITSLLSGKFDFSLKCTYSLRNAVSTIEVDQSRLELIIFNILYYCFNKTSLADSQPPQVKIHVHENTGDFVISVTDSNVPPLSDPSDLLVFDDSEDTDDDDSMPLYLNLNTVSLLLTKKLALQTKYQFDYKRLKTSNQYIIKIPKNISAVAKEFAIYETNTSNLLQSFADILLHFYQE